MEIAMSPMVLSESYIEGEVFVFKLGIQQEHNPFNCNVDPV